MDWLNVRLLGHCFDRKLGLVGCSDANPLSGGVHMQGLYDQRLLGGARALESSS